MQMVCSCEHICRPQTNISQNVSKFNLYESFSCVSCASQRVYRKKKTSLKVHAIAITIRTKFTQRIYIIDSCKFVCTPYQCKTNQRDEITLNFTCLVDPTAFIQICYQIHAFLSSPKTVLFLWFDFYQQKDFPCGVRWKSFSFFFLIYTSFRIKVKLTPVEVNDYF